jgi:hydrogenase maturation factor
MPELDLTDGKTMTPISRKSELQQLRWTEPSLGDFAFVHGGIAVSCHL